MTADNHLIEQGQKYRNNKSNNINAPENIVFVASSHSHQLEKINNDIYIIKN